MIKTDAGETHIGCDTSQCGACTILINGESAKACTVLAVQADGSEVTTIEGLAPEGSLHPIQEGFWEKHGLQCGFCTPGMIMASYQLLKNNPNPTETEIRKGLDEARHVRIFARVGAEAQSAGDLRMGFRELGTEIASHTVQVGHVKLDRAAAWEEIRAISGNLESPLRCVDSATEAKMKSEVDAALKAGDTVGGIFEVVAHQVPVGLGSHAQWDEKLDGKLAQAVMSIQAVKGVEIGAGVTAAGSYGSEVQDEISYDKAAHRFRRSSNRAGGLEGGMTNGEDVIVRGYLKPISTLRRALGTADLVTKEPVQAAYERSDWCVVPAAGVAGEAMVALVLADAFLQKFGGDSLAETRRNFDNYARQIDEF